MHGTLLGVNFWHDSLNFAEFPSKHVELWKFILGVVLVSAEQELLFKYGTRV